MCVYLRNAIHHCDIICTYSVVVVEILDCRLNNLSGTIDLSQNLELVNIDIARNSISNVVFGNNTKITRFHCAINRLDFIDITALPNLKDLG